MRNMPSQASAAVSDVSLASPRCQFSFADGRRCRMPSAPPTLCLAHAKTESQLSGQSLAVDLAPLSGEFRTATEVNCALGKVFLLLAQNRIPRRNAVALGYIAQLLLQTLPRVKEEFIAGLGYQAWQETLDSALQEDPEDDETEPAAEADATDEPVAEAHEVREVAVAVPLGTPISALASSGASAEPDWAAQIHTAAQPISETPIDEPKPIAVARVFPLPSGGGPEALSVPSLSPPERDVPIEPTVVPQAVAQEESKQPPKPKGIGPVFPFVSWREEVGPGWIYWDNPKVIEQLDNMEAIRRLRWWE